MKLWHIAQTMSGKEAAAEQWLRSHADAAETFFPQEVCFRRSPRTRTKIPHLRPVVPGYLMARFRGQPDCAVIRRDCKHITGWVMVGELPVVVTDAVLAQMRIMPDRLQQARDARTAAEKALHTFQVGDKAQIMEGPFSGLSVAVTGVQGGVVMFDLPNTKATAPATQLRKVAM